MNQGAAADYLVEFVGLAPTTATRSALAIECSSVADLKAWVNGSSQDQARADLAKLGGLTTNQARKLVGLLWENDGRSSLVPPAALESCEEYVGANSHVKSHDSKSRVAPGAPEPVAREDEYKYDRSPLLFHHRTTRWLLPNSVACGRLSALAYQTPRVIKRQCHEWGLQAEFISDAKTHTQAFVAADGNKVFVAFRGSEVVWTDWKTDFTIKMVRYRTVTMVEATDGTPVPIPLIVPGFVHQGFRDALESVYEKVEEALARLRTAAQPIYVTGHSLGAALATLFTARRQAADETVASLYTFGSPRVGNVEFQRWFDAGMKDRAFRIANNNDVVTRVPQRVIGYRHVGELRYLTADGKIALDMGMWNRFLDRYRGYWVDLIDEVDGIPDGFQDHFMAKYLEVLSGLWDVSKLAAEGSASASSTSRKRKRATGDDSDDSDFDLAEDIRMAKKYVRRRLSQLF